MTSFWSNFLQRIASGMKIMMMPITVPTTAAFSNSLAAKSSKTVPKSMRFGPTKTSAPILPSKLLLNLALATELVGSI